MKPYSESCEQNREPILAVLTPHLQQAQSLLEIGSGTGQHAVYFSPEFPELSWQTSDRVENHSGILAWLAEAGDSSIQPPLALDVSSSNWPDANYDAVYSANTAHIMHWTDVEAMFAGVGKVLNDNGVFMLYGPFNYNGQYTSQSNAGFDQWLKQGDPLRAIRDFEAVQALAEKAGLTLIEDNPMPANNRTLVWRKC